MNSELDKKGENTDYPQSHIEYAMSHMQPTGIICSRTSDGIQRRYVGIVEDQGEASRIYYDSTEIMKQCRGKY